MIKCLILFKDNHKILQITTCTYFKIKKCIQLHQLKVLGAISYFMLLEEFIGQKQLICFKTLNIFVHWGTRYFHHKGHSQIFNVVHVHLHFLLPSEQLVPTQHTSLNYKSMYNPNHPEFSNIYCRYICITLQLFYRLHIFSLLTAQVC